MKKDQKEKKNQIDRRQFLKDGGVATVAIGLGCFSAGGLREALALSRQTGKPILSESNLNGIIPKNTDGLRTFGGEVRRDLKALLRSRFAVTPAQEKEINSLSSSDISKINQAIDKAVELKVPLRVTIKGARRAGLTGAGTMKASFTGSGAASTAFLFGVRFCINRDKNGKFVGVTLDVNKSGQSEPCPGTASSTQP